LPKGLQGLLRSGQVTGLQCLADGREILLPLAILKGCSMREGPVLAQVKDGLEGLLGVIQIASLEGTVQMGQVHLASAEIRLRLLIGEAGQSCD